MRSLRPERHRALASTVWRQTELAHQRLPFENHGIPTPWRVWMNPPLPTPSPDNSPVPPPLGRGIRTPGSRSGGGAPCRA
ncbi:hypothetical protein D187_002544 [Cystobacter fuscus DSM 2262]|uniref:Uncharacterized protein n=1 Tax=Cystobacter fuscus (strain ATCC 25194 / DSM 2262 / NBRC 100088 / M29) TaxID=1242864 RepID=S9P5R1_CYSF2|nr:hypothetical protein D187_002544 [Cystobacter fuscus DSM 2262]